jgi:hypothetical protein
MGKLRNNLNGVTENTAEGAKLARQIGELAENSLFVDVEAASVVCKRVQVMKKEMEPFPAVRSGLASTIL